MEEMNQEEDPRLTGELTTKVIFRKWPKSEGGEVLAIFPEAYGEGASGTGYACYQHIGQHAECYRSIVHRTKRATAEEYAPLKKELEGLGYKLHVIQRWPKA